MSRSGQQKLIDPETFRDFYTCWKETEAQAQEVSLPAAVTEHLDKNECVYKLSGSVKTSRGVGKIAMTQKRLFLLTEGRPGYVEIATFRNIEVGAAPFPVFVRARRQRPRLCGGGWTMNPSCFPLVSPGFARLPRESGQGEPP